MIVGWILINQLIRVVFRILAKRNVEPSIRTFLQSFVGIILKILLLVTVATMLGLKTTSFVAALGAAGLAVGLALQGSLSNFAGGVLILVFHPFRVGDAIEAQGHIGKVREINIFNTVIITPDNKTVFIPNGSLANSALINYTETDTRRIEVVVGISYQADIDKARSIVFEELKKIPEILKDPEHVVGVAALADSSVNFSVRPWVKNDDYLSVMWRVQENIKKAFDQNNISIPFPQREVHVIRSDS